MKSPLLLLLLIVLILTPLTQQAQTMQRYEYGHLTVCSFLRSAENPSVDRYYATFDRGDKPIPRFYKRFEHPHILKNTEGKVQFFYNEMDVINYLALSDWELFMVTDEDESDPTYYLRRVIPIETVGKN